MWRRDFGESISGRRENMYKDSEMRESKMSSGNKARTFNIEGKAHHLGHGIKKDRSMSLGPDFILASLLRVLAQWR